VGSIEKRTNRQKREEQCRKKERFATEESAAHFAELRLKRYYHCDICNEYHLTSKDDSWKGVY
jgi:hypothetical protein